MSSRWFTLVICVCLLSTTALPAGAQSNAGPFDGQWVIQGDAWFDGMATGRTGGGRGRGEQEASPDISLQLAISPLGAVSGIAVGAGGRRGAPGSHPAHPVEITRGALDGDVLRFEIWRYDRFHNRLFVEARVAGDELALVFRRDTPTGPDTFSTRARRAPRGGR